MKRNDVHVSHSCRSLVVFDLVLLLVQLPSSEKVVDRLVILAMPINDTIPEPRDYAYDFQKLALHLVLPTFLLHHPRDPEYLFHGTRYHTLGRLRNPALHSERFTRASLTIRENADVVSVDTALSQLRYILEDFGLSRMWFKDLEWFHERYRF